MFTSTVTSSICEWPLESQRIRLLAPGALPSTTSWVGEVASVSITAGLLDKILVTGDCRFITTDFPTNTCSACPSDCAPACALASTIPMAASSIAFSPNAMCLIFFGTGSSSLEFLDRTLCSLNDFHHVNRCGRRWFGAALDPWRGYHRRRRFASHNQLVESCRAQFGDTLLIDAASQNELNIPLRTSQLQLLRVLRCQQQSHHIHGLRFSLWIGFDRLSCSQHLNVLQNRLGHGHVGAGGSERHQQVDV